jgi:hypothetical protein
MLDRALEHEVGPSETVAGVEQAIDLGAVFRPLIDLLEVRQHLARERKAVGTKSPPACLSRSGGMGTPGAFLSQIYGDPAAGPRTGAIAGLSFSLGLAGDAVAATPLPTAGAFHCGGRPDPRRQCCRACFASLVTDQR